MLIPCLHGGGMDQLPLLEQKHQLPVQELEHGPVQAIPGKVADLPLKGVTAGLMRIQLVGQVDHLGGNAQPSGAVLCQYTASYMSSS